MQFSSSSHGYEQAEQHLALEYLVLAAMPSSLATTTIMSWPAWIPISIAIPLEHAMTVKLSFVETRPQIDSHITIAVSVHCKDTRIVVNVNTNKPFSGRIYALGRSETCNVDVINSDSFRLDLTMSGQDCNTQSVVSIFN